jgi:uncharacterized membrane protein
MLDMNLFLLGFVGITFAFAVMTIGYKTWWSKSRSSLANTGVNKEKRHFEVFLAVGYLLAIVLLLIVYFYG